MYFVGILDFLSVMVRRDIIADHPNLKKVVENVTNLDSIKKWIAKRPVTEF